MMNYQSRITGFIFACILFAISVSVHVPLVDKTYPYTFEPDAEPCVEVTRSFYYFFQHPVRENFPQTLTAYPNYSDGDFIVSALFANVVAKLCKWGIIKTPLSDSDYSLIIFSMRWAGVLFDALAVLLTFFILKLLTRNNLLAFGICLFYYLLTPRVLRIDLIRIDHYSLFAANLTMYAAMAMYYMPGKKRYYLLSGIGAGLVSATKINFPFYLLILVIIFCYLLYRKKVTVIGFVIIAGAFAATFAFMYQRWLMYPENIYQTIVKTLTVGEEWVGYWGNKNYFFYMGPQFYSHGPSLAITLLMIIFYASLAYCIVSAIVMRSALKSILCITFLMQVVFLMFSPKVGRYGVIISLWVCIFIALSFNAVISLVSRKTTVALLLLLLMVPGFIYAVGYLRLRVNTVSSYALTIQQNRVAPYNWILQNVKPGSRIAIQHPRYDNPPVFDLPYKFTTRYLQFQYLYKDSMNSFHPNLEGIKSRVNYIIVTDKETECHFSALDRWKCDPSLTREWKQFYSSIDSFPHWQFKARHDNYGVKTVTIYKISDSIKGKHIIEITTHDTVLNNQNTLLWACHYDTVNGIKPALFQVQISEDSQMRWLVYGSRDGYTSKYRLNTSPVSVNDNQVVYIPAKINKAFDDGMFKTFVGNNDLKRLKPMIGSFFARVMLSMHNNNYTFSEAVKENVDFNTDTIVASMAGLYGPSADLLHAHLDKYLKITGLEIDTTFINSYNLKVTQWQFVPPISLEKGKRYFWRVRVKHDTDILSSWSPVNSFIKL